MVRAYIVCARASRASASEMSVGSGDQISSRAVCRVPLCAFGALLACARVLPRACL